jgi:hypothetical protein
VERCSYKYDCYGCSWMHILMLKVVLFHNSISTSAKTKIESTWLDYQNWNLYWHGQKRDGDG